VCGRLAVWSWDTPHCSRSIHKVAIGGEDKCISTRLVPLLHHISTSTLLPFPMSKSISRPSTSRCIGRLPFSFHYIVSDRLEYLDSRLQNTPSGGGGGN